MSIEWQSKAENPVEKRRPSWTLFGGFGPIQVSRVRQPFMAKEPLCGNQPANLSLVIAEFRFPSYFVILLFSLFSSKEVFY